MSVQGARGASDCSFTFLLQPVPNFKVAQGAHVHCPIGCIQAKAILAQRCHRVLLVRAPANHAAGWLLVVVKLGGEREAGVGAADGDTQCVATWWLKAAEARAPVGEASYQEKARAKVE